VPNAGDLIGSIPSKDERLGPAVDAALQDYAVIIMAPDGTVQSWSEGAETIFGYTASEVAGRPLTVLFTPEDQARGAPAGELATAARQGRAEVERWHMRKGGKPIWVAGTVRALRDDNGDITGFVELAREVTTKKFAELSREAQMEREQQARAELERVNAELQAEGERLAVEIRERQRAEQVAKTQASTLADQAALLDLAQDAIFALRMDSTITYWNLGAEKMYGWGKQEAMDRNVHELLRTEFPIPLEEIRDALVQTGQWSGECEHYTSNGEAVTVLTSWALRMEDGEPAGWLEIAHDVTEMRLLEEQLRETQKLESLGVLAGGVAHDFNNLLTGIMGNVSLAIDLCKSGADVSDILNNALHASEKAAYLTSQMLAYVGKGQFVIQSVDLASPVREAFRLVRGSIPDSVQVEFDFRQDLCIRADPTQLQQVAMNLILNAVEAVGEHGGGIVVRLTTRHVDPAADELRCDVGQLAPGDYGVLEVQDTGPGIDPSIRPKIFDPFFTTKFAGRGLGLASTAGIVRLLHGAILVESEPGRGTTFQVLLPMDHGAEAMAAVRQVQDPILIVDDEEVVLQAASAMLRNNGYEVALAGNGRQAVDLFSQRDGRFTLVLLDLTMPIMGGPQTIRQLKAIRPEVPVLVSTGLTEETAMRRFAGTDIAGFIQKPYTLRALIEKIRSVLGPADSASPKRPVDL
jgi:PAS domain S-box-containing protein